MRVLFAVDSFFQLIEAVNLRFTLYKDEEADVAIYASTPNTKEICRNLKEMKVFDQCFYLDTPLVRCGSNFNFKDKLPKYFIYLYTLINPKGYAKYFLGISDLKYDQFLFSGIGALPECIFNALKKTNRNLSCMRFEDSYISYTRQFGKAKGKARKILEAVTRKLFINYDIEKYIKGYYFTSPELVQVEFPYPVIDAPKINRNNLQLISILNEAFDFNELEDSYTEKFIFFESGDSYFEKNNEDVEFIQRLAKYVGKDQILIKRHPRCVENRFENLGVHIAQASSIPWELIQLNKCMDKKVFLTTTSSAALSSEIYFGDDCKAVLLFEAMRNPPTSVSDVMRCYMKDFQQKYGKDRLYLPHDLSEFESIIKKEI